MTSEGRVAPRTTGPSYLGDRPDGDEPTGTRCTKEGSRQTPEERVQSVDACVFELPYLEDRYQCVQVPIPVPTRRPRQSRRTPCRPRPEPVLLSTSTCLHTGPLRPQDLPHTTEE